MLGDDLKSVKNRLEVPTNPLFFPPIFYLLKQKIDDLIAKKYTPQKALWKGGDSCQLILKSDLGLLFDVLSPFVNVQFSLKKYHEQN